MNWCFFFSSRRRHTRYIGDWSSDVCSSDLRSGPRPVPRQAGTRMTPVTAPRPPVAVVVSFVDCINRGDVDGLAALMTEDHELRVFDEAPLSGQIGRASCRERVEVAGGGDVG